MTETLAALFFAHVLADFVFQTSWMVAHKCEPKGLAAHGAVVLVTAVAATGGLDPALVWLTAVHMAVDGLKAQMKHGIGPFLLDQAAHIATILAVAAARPEIWGEGLWASLTPLPALMFLTGGAILATRGGGFAIGILMEPFAARLPTHVTVESLPGAGRVIGVLERGLIFALILLGQPEGVGLLIAAKSILRFGALKDDRALSEYVIIGTLASFAWAILIAYATLSALAALPPLGFPPTIP